MKSIRSIFLLFGLCLALAACGGNAAPANPSLTFSKEQPLQVPGVSEATGKGTLSFSAGPTAGTLRLSINGEVPVLDQASFCFFCVDTVKIAAGLKVPVEFLGPLAPPDTVKINEGNVTFAYKFDDVQGTLVPKEPREIEKLIFASLVADYPIMENSVNALVAGDQGATLKKDGKSFTLVEGSAHLLK
jgi:hypothetical protein